MLEKLVDTVVGYRSRRDSDATVAEYAGAAGSAAVARAASAARRLGLPDAVLAAMLGAALFAGAAATAFTVAVAAAVLPAHPAAQMVVLALGGANVFVGLPLVAVKAAAAVGERSRPR
jgi:hypothetical protein